MAWARDSDVGAFAEPESRIKGGMEGWGVLLVVVQAQMW